MSYSITLAAQNDIEEIVASIWQENPGAAEQVEELLFQAFALLAENPRLGHRRQDLTDRPVLFWPVRRTPCDLQGGFADCDRQGHPLASGRRVPAFG